MSYGFILGFTEGSDPDINYRDAHTPKIWGQPFIGHVTVISLVGSDPGRAREIEMLVDMGAFYTIIRLLWRKNSAWSVQDSLFHVGG